MNFVAPHLLWLAVPWLLLGWFFLRRQYRALSWVRRRVAPRFQRLFSVHSPITLTLHGVLWLLLGLVLIVAAAGPVGTGASEGRPLAARVVLLVDASASMNATDLLTLEDESPTRLEIARRLTRGLVRRLVNDRPGTRFAVLSYSGSTAVHLALTEDGALVDEALAALQLHTFYQNSGSSLGSALDAVLQYAQQDAGEPVQGVLLSDGEIPQPDEYDDPLAALASSGTPIHTVAIGTEVGQGRLLYDFRDVVAGKEEKRVLRDFHTRREDRHLMRVARRTGGRFLVVDDARDLVDAVPEEVEPLTRLLRAIDEAQERFATLPAAVEAAAEEREGNAGLLRKLFLFALCLFLLDALVVGQPWRDRRKLFHFDLSRIGGRGLLLVALGLFTACWGKSIEEQAHQENERGITRDRFGAHNLARPHYERSRAFGVKPAVPTHNLARSVTLKGDYSEAHDLYQEAMQLDPTLPQPYHNDGVALYRWGEAERDPEGCRLERTLELWRAAGARFASIPDYPPARLNHRAVEQAITQVEALIADPPPNCQAEAEAEARSESESQSHGGGGGGNQEQEPQGGSSGGEMEQDGGGVGEDSGEGPLSDQELTEVQEALERMEEQRGEQGKYHRRTLPEQFPKEAWEKPQPEIWW